MSTPNTPSTPRGHQSPRSPLTHLEYSHPSRTITTCTPPLTRRPPNPKHTWKIAPKACPSPLPTSPSPDPDRMIDVGPYRISIDGNQNLFHTQLFEAKLNLLNLRDADLRFADLRGCDFTCSDLTGAKLLGAHLADADFFLAKGVELPEGWELVNHRAQKKDGWKFDHHGRAVRHDRDQYLRESAHIFD